MIAEPDETESALATPAQPEPQDGPTVLESYKEELHKELQWLQGLGVTNVAEMHWQQTAANAGKAATKVTLQAVDLNRTADGGAIRSFRGFRLGFQPNKKKSGIVEVFIGVDLYIKEKHTLVARLNLLLRRDDGAVAKGAYNESPLKSLQDIDDNDSQQRSDPLLQWTVYGSDRERYAAMWYNRPPAAPNRMGMDLAKPFAGFRVRTAGRTSYVERAGAGAEVAYPLAKQQALALVIRAVDWIANALFDKKPFLIGGSANPTLELASAEKLGLPKPEDYFPGRPVDLAPAVLRGAAEGVGLRLPWSVYQAVCQSMNLGRHLILTGPPGCGKSRLAVVVAKLIAEQAGVIDSGVEPKVVTASPAWTSGDVIGRYFPSHGDGRLVFQPGVFLQAIREGRSLIIDEFNRANIDECFGELFTVLAGQPVDLPFFDRDPDRDGAQHLDGEPKPIPYYAVRIVPRNHQGLVPENRVIYELSPTFRLIGTMNDADRSALHALSFALLRRFDVVRVDAPSVEVLQELARDTVKQAFTDSGSKSYTISPKPKKGQDFCDIEQKELLRLSQEVFCPKHQNGGYPGLVPSYVVGVSTMLDVIRLVREGLRPTRSEAIGANQGDGKVRVRADTLPDLVATGGAIQPFVASLLMHAIVLTVVPQLEALDNAGFDDAVRHLDSIWKNLTFVRIDAVVTGTQGSKPSSTDLRLVVDASRGAGSVEFRTVHDIFFEELERAVRGTSRVANVRQLAAEMSY